MKKIIRVLMLLSVVSVFAVKTSQAQIVVRVQPARPRGVVLVKPRRPSARYVWVAEEWTPNGGSYAYKAGYWAIPPHPGAIWVAGSWRHTARGYAWVGGRWR